MGGKESKNPQLVRTTYLWEVNISPKMSLLKPKFSDYFEVFGDAYRLGLHKDRNYEIKLHRKGESDVSKRFRCVSALLDDRYGQYYSETKEVEFGKDANDVVIMSVPETLLEDENSDVTSTNIDYFSLKVSSVDYSDSPGPDMDYTAATLSSDLKKLRSIKPDCDVKIYSSTGQCVEAHRLILSARSPVFAAMFRQGSTRESREGVIRLTDVDSPTLDKLLIYMYTGQVYGLDSGTAARLLEVADKYDLPELRESCLETLLDNLTLGNVCEAVVLSETRDLPSLGREVRAFVAENAVEVMQSDGWKELQDRHPEMVNSVLADLLLSEEKKEEFESLP